MGTWRTMLLVIGAAVLVFAVLFGTGVIGVNRTERGEKGNKRAASRSPDVEDLGYLAKPIAPEDAKKKGVTVHKPGAEDGLVLWHTVGWAKGVNKAPASRPWDEFHLVDLDGKELHTWKGHRFGEAKPEHALALLRPDGHLVQSYIDAGMVELDWDSNVVWKLEGFFHHHIAAGPDGTVLTHSRRKLAVPVEGDEEVEIADESLVVISAKGEKLEELWLSDILADYAPYREKLAAAVGKKKPKEGVDIFHVNSVEVLPADPQGLWSAGDLLFSARNLDLVAIVSRDGKTLRWSFGPDELDRQHSATMPAIGRVLVFDNGTKRRKHSRIVEIDVRTNEIAWSYEADPPKGFFSDTRGLTQRLAGGNVFVVESNRGRIFETTQQGEIVWEFFSAQRFSGKELAIRAFKVEGELLAAMRARLGK